jgi:hypothetical protein
MNLTEDKFQSFVELSHENQLAIKSLTKIAEKTSQDIDRMVEKQNEILVNQEQMKLINQQLATHEKKIEKIEGSITWTVRSIIGAIIVALLAVIGVNVK